MKLKTNMEQGKDVVFTPITNPIHKDLHLHEVVVKVQKDGMIKVPISNMNIKTMRTAPSAVQVGAVTELKDQTIVSGNYISGLSKSIIDSESKKLKNPKQGSNETNKGGLEILTEVLKNTKNKQAVNTLNEIHVQSEKGTAIITPDFDGKVEWNPVKKPTGEDVFRELPEDKTNPKQKTLEELVMKLTPEEEQMILNDDEDELRFKTIAADSEEETEFEVKVKVGYKGMPSETLRAYKRIILEHKRVFAFDESEVGRINGYCYDMLFKVNKVIRHPPTKISPRDREACKEIIEKMVGKDNEPSIDPAINREQWICEDPETRNKLSIVQRSEPSILKASASNSHEHMTLWHSLVKLHADLLEAFYQKIVTSPNHPGLVTPGSFAVMA